MRRVLASLFTLIGLSTVLASHGISTVETPVIDFGVDNFTQELSDSRYAGSTWLIEYYAHWCPHCQHFKPIFEKIGTFFNKEPRPKPLLWVARVDCAEQGNMPLCDKFLVKSFPTILLGRVSDFLEHKEQDLTSIPVKQPLAIIDFINANLGTHYVFEENKKTLDGPMERGKDAERKGFDVDDVERATVELFEHLFSSTLILQSLEVRQDFQQWIALLSEAHPSPRCRQSFRYLKKQIGVLWPEDSVEPSPYLSRLHVCTAQYEKKEWQSCAASVPNRRGFTCGLWQLLHALAVGIEELQTDLWMQGVRAFSRHFFGCAECAKHFLLTLEKDEARNIQSRTELVMWLWSTHNRVNKRLSREESENGMGDPAFPKVQWPPVSLCSQCQSTSSSLTEDQVDWKEYEVLEFLNHFYAAVDGEEQPIRASRKGLIDGAREFTSIDVFSKEDAAAMELHARTGKDVTWYVLIVMIILVVVLVRRSRKRKLVPIAKDIL